MKIDTSKRPSIDEYVKNMPGTTGFQDKYTTQGDDAVEEWKAANAAPGSNDKPGETDPTQASTVNPNDKGSPSDQEVKTLSEGTMGAGAVMDKFYNWETADDDYAANTLKATYMADMATSAFGAQQAQAMAWTNAEIQDDQMQQTAALERYNTGINMAQEFGYGMANMGAQADIQDQFATNQAVRDLNTMGYAGDIQRSQTQTEGEEQRETTRTQGEQHRQTIDTQSAADVTSIAAKGLMDIESIKESGTQDIERMETQGIEDRATLADQIVGQPKSYKMIMRKSGINIR